MDEQRSRIRDDLRGLIAGDLLFEPIERAAYSVDASLYEIEPLGVIVPRTLEDVLMATRYAAEHQIPLHPRGGGTGVAGESLGRGIGLDFSRYFRRIVEIGHEYVVAQSGVVVDSLNSQLAPLGRRLGPDPGGSEACTIGGMVAADAAGIQSLRYGTTADHVVSLDIVFAHGETATAAFEPWPKLDEIPSEFKQRLMQQLAVLYKHHGEQLSRWLPVSPRNRAGYAFCAAASEAGLDLARLITGSEGTLAILTEAKLRTVPIPQAQAVLLAAFDRLADAAAAVPDCLDDNPSACELLDRRLISLARDYDFMLRDCIPDSSEGLLIIAFDDDDPTVVEHAVRSLSRRLSRRVGLAATPLEIDRRQDCRRMLGLRRHLLPQLLRTALPARAAPIFEDAAVPIACLAEFLQSIQTAFKNHEVSGTIYAHAGAGQVHARPFLDLSSATDRAKIEPLSEEVHAAALALEGTVSGEHGCGLARSRYLKRQYADLFNIFREIKTAFDPQNLLNPGIIVADDPKQLTSDLRAFPEPAARAEPAADSVAMDEAARHPIDEAARHPNGEAARQSATGLSVIEPLLRWNDATLLDTATSCNGCGVCRSGEETLRMCPTFRALGVEAATPRAQANLIRQIAAGKIDPRYWGAEELKQNANLCVHCHMCKLECPSGVDVSSLMLEAKAAYVVNHGLTTTDWMLSRVDRWSKLAGRLPLLANFLLANKTSRWLLERFFGLSRHRRLPRARRFSFVRRAERQGLGTPRPQKPGPRVAYFVDVFANHFDHELAESTVAVLQHAGVNVYVPRGQRGSGMPALVVGDLDRARELALANLRILGDVVRDGYTIVCSEPTAALMLRSEYLKLTDDLDASLVAEHTMDVGQYLVGLGSRGLLPPLELPLRARVGYHQPCHLRSLEIGTPGLDLMRGIPGLDIHFIDRGCSGMAGTFGLAKDNFRTSLRAGRPLLSRLREPDLEFGATECGACRMQMEQSAPKWTLHPIKILSLGFGLNPALRERLHRPKAKHVVK